MKFIVLSDNRTQSENFGTEHGLSIYLETEKHTILLDAGASDLFIQNAEIAGVDLKSVDYFFLSHGHKDHGGGLESFLKLNTHALVIASRLAINQRYYSKRLGFRDLGVYLGLKTYSERFLFYEDHPELPEEINIIRAEKKIYPQPKGNETLFQIIRDGMEPDKFEHELIFTYQGKKLVVYTGCAHAGVLNILDSVSEQLNTDIHLVLGGFHLLRSNENHQFETASEIESLALGLKSGYPDTKFYTGHCTGDHAEKSLKKILIDKVEFFYSGCQKDI